MRDKVHRLTSAHLGNDRTVWIREPGSPSAPSAVAIFLDGEFYRDRVGAEAVIDALEAESGIANTLFVFVSVEGVDARWRECPCHDPFAAFVVDELLPWLWLQYPAAKTSPERVLIGLSYTGLAAAFVALRSIDKFTRIVAQSGSFWSNDCWLVDQFSKLKKPLPTAFYLDVGSDETAENVRHKEDILQVVSQIDAVRRFRDVLIASGHEVKYLEFAGGHDFLAWRETLPDALRWALARQP